MRATVTLAVKIELFGSFGSGGFVNDDKVRV